MLIHVLIDGDTRAGIYHAEILLAYVDSFGTDLVTPK